MIKPGKTKNEDTRVSALRNLAILDTPTEKQYDNITELAAYICDCPIALISLIDEDRQWIKSKVGLDICESPRDESFCGHAIMADEEIMEVPDARRDERFKDNPFTLAKGKPVVFYAGYKLRDAKENVLGTLCLIDHKPRKLDDKQRKALKTLGNQVRRLFELRLKNNELLKSKTELSENNELLKSFAGTVSHDLKMPLSNIIMTIDVLKRKYGDKLDKDALAYFDRLKQSSFGMSDYISNILTYYETENISYRDVEEEPFELKAFLESILDMLNIESDCEINLPEGNNELICNRYGLEQIFLNLLGNSLKYNNKKKTIIDITFDEVPGFYKFTVTDNGMGIPTDQQETIFKLFSTATPTDRYGKKGNGIGLSTVKKLVQKLEGTIEVSSEVDNFTTFTFSIKKQAPKPKKIP